MSYVLDGKISNQHPRKNMSGSCLCGRCSKMIPRPQVSIFKTYNKELVSSNYVIYHYIQESHFIYETRAGYSVVYCSEYCRNKHNHRYN